MKVSYRGIQGELPPKIQEKLDVKFAKLSKLLEKRGEKEAHVVITTERHLHHAEITMQFYDHQFVGLGSGADLLAAMTGAHRETGNTSGEAARQVAGQSPAGGFSRSRGGRSRRRQCEPFREQGPVDSGQENGSRLSRER